MEQPQPDAAELGTALAAAREAYAAATDALACAKAAARTAGVTADSDAAVPELRVQRIRVVEPDGTTRMIIGNSTISTIAPMRGEDQDHPGRGSIGGILFCNDEGTEAGGLVYAGAMVEGEPSQVGFWTVDDFEQQEGFRLGAKQVGEARTKWIEFADLPYFSVVDYFADAKGKTGEELDEVQRRYWPDGAGNGVTRMRLSKEADGTAALSLRDADGTERIRLAVSADGSTKITATAIDGSEHPLFVSER